MKNKELQGTNSVENTFFTCPPKRLLRGITEMSLFTRCRRACAHRQGDTVRGGGAMSAKTSLSGSHAGVSNRPSLSCASSHLHDPGNGGQQHTVTHVRAMAPQEPGLGIDGLRTLTHSVRIVSGREAGFGSRAEPGRRGGSSGQRIRNGPANRVNPSLHRAHLPRGHKLHGEMKFGESKMFSRKCFGRASS